MSSTGSSSTGTSSIGSSSNKSSSNASSASSSASILSSISALVSGSNGAIISSPLRISDSIVSISSLGEVSTTTPPSSLVDIVIVSSSVVIETSSIDSAKDSLVISLYVYFVPFLPDFLSCLLNSAIVFLASPSPVTLQISPSLSEHILNSLSSTFPCCSFNGFSQASLNSLYLGPLISSLDFKPSP